MVAVIQQLHTILPKLLAMGCSWASSNVASKESAGTLRSGRTLRCRVETLSRRTCRNVVVAVRSSDMPSSAAFSTHSITSFRPLAHNSPPLDRDRCECRTVPMIAECRCIRDDIRLGLVYHIVRVWKMVGRIGMH